MDVPFWVWALTIAAIVGMLIFDFVGHVRTPHAPTLRESAIWSAVYVGIAVVFGLLVFVFAGAEFGGEYFAGYITEKSLSVDNLFVFVLIMAGFGVPRELQQKVLLFGITFALVLRTVFILVGAAAIENFSWVFYLFGAFLDLHRLGAGPQRRAQRRRGLPGERASSGSPARCCRRPRSTTPTG